MLDRRDHIMMLNAGRKRRTHCPQMMWVFAVSFLRSPPAGMAQQVDADRARQVAPLRAHFGPHRDADALFKISIKARAARHRAGKSG